MNISKNIMKRIRLIVYLMLALSSTSTFILSDKLWSAAKIGELSPWIAGLPAICFIAFVIVYAIDRWFLIKNHRYPIFRALLQIAFTCVFLIILLPEQASEYQQSKTNKLNIQPISLLLKHKNASVRALSCELIGWRNDTSKLNNLILLSQNDKSAYVRKICLKSLNKLKK